MNRRLPAVLLAVAGLLLVAFPLLRPWQDKAGDLGGAFADPRWVAAHTCAMIAFVLLGLGMRLWARHPQDLGARAVDLPGVETRVWVGAALLLPYFGAETFGLHALATTAGLDAADLLATSDAVRLGPVPAALFALGLLALALAGVRLARATWSAGTATRVGGLLTGVGLLTYLPQFFAPPAGRVVHGLLLAAGLLVLAAGRWRGGRGAPAAHPEQVSSAV